MNFFSGFFKGIRNCFRGFSLLFEKGLWPYMLYPLILWILMWVATIWLFALAAGEIKEWLDHQFQFSTIPDSGHWLSFAKPFLTGYFSFMLSWVLKLVFWFFSRTFSKYILLIVLSPLFALLSERAEEKLNGRDFPFSLLQLFKDIFRGIGISLRNMFLEFGIIITCSVLTLFFPPLVFITAPFLMLVSWYFLGFTMLDYNFERHRMTISDSVHWIRRHRGLACGIGLVYAFFMALPGLPGDVIGMMLGPILATLGATISFVELNTAASQPVQTVSHV